MDFSTLEKRCAASLREVEINRPQAPEIYIDAVPITRQADGALAIAGTGQPVDWVVRMNRFDQAGLFDRLQITARKMNGWFPEDPVEIFRRHVWINPFWEDDLVSVVEWMGADRVVFGSDWPHIEALPEPLDYLAEAKALDAADRRRVLHDNAVELTALRPR